MKSLNLIVVITIIISSIATGCGTLKEKKIPPEKESTTPVTENRVNTEAEKEAPPEKIPEKKPPPEQDTQEEKGPVPTEEITINKTIETESIINVIESLEECYKNKDYEKWKSFLTKAYKERYNNPEYLHKEGWGVNSLEEFFNLLVETRKSSNIEALETSRVEFLSDNKALVYVKFKGKEFPKPQHTFIRINGKWYKGLIDEEPENKEKEK